MKEHAASTDLRADQWLCMVNGWPMQMPLLIANLQQLRGEHHHREDDGEMYLIAAHEIHHC